MDQPNALTGYAIACTLDANQPGKVNLIMSNGEQYAQATISPEIAVELAKNLTTMADEARKVGGG
jgi:hypothetical protein